VVPQERAPEGIRDLRAARGVAIGTPTSTASGSARYFSA